MNLTQLLTQAETIAPASSERLPAADMAQLIMRLSPGDGFTIAPDGTPAQPHGYALAQPDTITYAMNLQSLEQWYSSLNLPANGWIGGWHDPENGVREANVTFIIADMDRALMLCQQLGEDAVYGLKEGHNIYADTRQS